MQKLMSLREMEARLEEIDTDAEIAGLVLSARYQLNTVLCATDLSNPRISLAMRKARYCLAKIEFVLISREVTVSRRVRVRRRPNAVTP